MISSRPRTAALSSAGPHAKRQSAWRAGPPARVRNGDTVTVDAVNGTLVLHVPEDEFAARTPTGRAPGPDEFVGTGRELFASMRAAVGPADQGASVFPAYVAR